MENKEWEETLRDILGNYTPEEMHPDWTAFSDYQHEHVYLEDITNDADFDEGIREPLSSFEYAGQKSAGWERIESSLETDAHFDETVRRRIQDFQTQYEPHTWSKLLSRISGIGYLRTKLIAFKVVEVTAVLLLLLTVLKMSHMDKLPFDNNHQEQPANPAQDEPTAPGNDRADASPGNVPTQIDGLASGTNRNADDNKNQLASKNFDGSQESLLSSTANTNSNKYYSDPVNPATPATEMNPAAKTSFAASADGEVIAGSDASENLKAGNILNHPIVTNVNGVEIPSISGSITPVSSSTSAEQKAEITSITDAAPGMPSILKYDDNARHDVARANFLATSFRPLSWSKDNLPKPKYVKQRPRRFTEFGVIAQMDYNRLRMPEDKLYSAGNRLFFRSRGFRVPAWVVVLPSV